MYAIITKKMTQALSLAMLFIGLLYSSQALAARLVDVQFSSQPGGSVEANFIFDGAFAEPRSYGIESPARISLDLPGVSSALAERYLEIGQGNVRTATVVTAGDVTRVVFNLNNLVGYEIERGANNLKVIIGGASGARQAAAPAAPTVEAQAETVRTNRVSTGPKELVDIDFRRGSNGEGRVLFRFSDNAANARIDDRGNRVVLNIPNYRLPSQLQRRLDVTDFGTAVQFIDAFQDDSGTRIVLEPTGNYDMLAYQVDSVLTIEMKALTQAEADDRRSQEFPYTGEPIFFNFQRTEVRAVLQLLADQTGLNLVVSDSVTGDLTLRLQGVPWDQALDIVLQTKGLGKRQSGNVLLVAPAEELAERELLQLEASRQIEELAPLQTAFLQVNYAKAVDLVEIIAAERPGMLSDRGSASADPRTNTLLVNDTAINIERVREALTIFDIPVRQVQIEARIVIARSDVGRDLGVRWGGATNVGANPEVRLRGNRDALNSDLSAPSSLGVNLPVSGNTSGLAVGITALDYVLDFELTALETSGKAEIVSRPKIMTSDGRSAKVASGTEIPYVTADGIEFRDATLSLEVQPFITPDNRIIMDLVVTQDSVGSLIGNLLTIDKNQLQTQVLVDNGGTVVLGGVYRNSDVTRVDKTPILSSIPVLGSLFRRTSVSSEKNELLIFITPTLVEESLTRNR